MALPLRRAALAFVPFALIGLTLAWFAATGDPMAFAAGGLLACVYLLAFFLVERRRRRARAPVHRRAGRK